jgi:hypothetical protein
MLHQESNPKGVIVSITTDMKDALLQEQIVFRQLFLVELMKAVTEGDKSKWNWEEEKKSKLLEELNTLASLFLDNKYFPRRSNSMLVNELQIFDKKMRLFLLPKGLSKNTDNIPDQTRENVIKALNAEVKRMQNKYGPDSNPEKKSIARERIEAINKLLKKLTNDDIEPSLLYNEGTEKALSTKKITADQLVQQLKDLKLEMRSTGDRLGRLTRNSLFSFVTGSTEIDKIIDSLNPQKTSFIEKVKKRLR